MSYLVAPRRPGRLRLQRLVKPLKVPVLLVVSWLDPLWRCPQLDPPRGQWTEAYQADAGQWRAVVVRMARGRPYSRKARSSERLISGPMGRSRLSHTSRYRDIASWAVTGSMRFPFPVWKMICRSPMGWPHHESDLRGSGTVPAKVSPAHLRRQSHPIPRDSNCPLG